MRKTIAALAVLVVIGCSSTSNSASNATSPEILLVQTSNVPAAARYTDSPLQIHYAMRVENRALEPITLKQVTVQSVSEGAYFVAPTSKPYDLQINAKERQEVEFWVSATPGRSVVGANGPVTLRVTCRFQNATGATFQEIVMQRVNERASISGE
ncbi:MAG: hypothetical protein ACJ74H_01330 [Thermoanaerobaculia bacterium]